MSQLVPPKFGGNKPARVAGTIRPGIRRLTAKGRENAEAVKIYRAGIASGQGYKAIADAIKSATGQVLTTPTNVAYFSVREGDFSVKELAQKILADFGEPETIEGVVTTVVKRLPIFLFGDTVEENVDFSFQAFNGVGILYWSAEATEDEPKLGVTVGDRVCKTLQPMATRQDGKAVRQPGGRTPVTRGKCVPGSCPEYQSGSCQMKGNLYFHVPGINVSAPLRMPISSKTFGIEAEDTMDRVRAATNGNLTGFSQPVFFLSKQLREVSMLDEAGKPKPVKQFITTLEAMVDMPKLRMMRHEALPNAANASVLALGGVPVAMPTGHEEPALENDSGSSAASAHGAAPSRDTVPSASVSPDAPQAQAEPLPPAAAAATQQQMPKGVEPDKSGRSLQLQVSQLAKSAGMTDLARFKAYANTQFGTGWGSQVAGCESAIALLTDIAKPRAALVAALTQRNVSIENWIVDDPEPPFWDFTLDGINERLKTLAD